MTLVTTDIPENSYVTMKGNKNMDIRKNNAAPSDVTLRNNLQGKLKGIVE